LREIIIATRNRGKTAEIREILSLGDVVLSDLHDIDFPDEIEENGETFEENALIKAETLFRVYKRPVIADDSGLVVPYLNGEPGVRSARYAGSDASDEDNNKLLLAKLSKAAGSEREAFFRCVAVFYTGPGQYRTAEATVHGNITLEAVGSGGFGYDPLFYVARYKKTMAQLDSAVKNRISHRGTAFSVLKEYIRAYLAGNDAP
jgi:XTP/dITP diphosphohydrolase